MSVAKDLREGFKAAIVASGAATAPAIFYSRMPATPDEAVVITWYPLPLEHREGVQVRVRGRAASTTSAEDRALDIVTALHGLEHKVWGDTQVELVHLASGARMGADANQRDEVALNFYAVTSNPSVSLVD